MIFNGYEVVISEHLPREHVADEVYSCEPHPFWKWLRRNFGVGYRTSVERGDPIYEDKVFMAAGKLLMSRRTWGELKRVAASSAKGSDDSLPRCEKCGLYHSSNESCEKGQD